MKKKLALLFIILLAAGLRLYKLSEMAPFGFDQEYAANFAYSVVKDFPIRMVGQGLSLQGLFIGPWYFYFLTPFYMLTNLHPIGGAIGSVVLGLIIIAVYYFVVKSFFGYKAGLVTAFLRAVSFSAIETDWATTPAFSSELAVIIIFWCLFQYWKGNLKIFPLLALIFGLLTSFHPILFPMYFVFIFIILIKRILPPLKTTLISLGLFILPILPLLVFEYIRKFAMTKVVIDLFTHDSSKSILNLNRLDMYQRVITASLEYVLGINASGLILVLISLVLLSILFFKLSPAIERNFHLVMLPGTIIIFLLYYLVYPAHVPEYYIGAIHTLFYLYLGGAIGILFNYSKPVKLLAIILLVNISFYNINKLVKRWNYPSHTNLAHEDFIVKAILDRMPNNDFFVSYITLPGWDFGYPYLFKYYNRIPKKDILEYPVFTIVSPLSLSIDSINISSGNVGLILP
ncbi:glycosyltransferase family 39 protein [Patescibacteria group bacterium]|nr:glycosyltransferase family 39 protein [Patescibacteria group bacterium]